MDETRDKAQRSGRGEGGRGGLAVVVKPGLSEHTWPCGRKGSPRRAGASWRSSYWTGRCRAGQRTPRKRPPTGPKSPSRLPGGPWATAHSHGRLRQAWTRAVGPVASPPNSSGNEWTAVGQATPKNTPAERGAPKGRQKRSITKNEQKGIFELRNRCQPASRSQLPTAALGPSGLLDDPDSSGS